MKQLPETFLYGAMIGAHQVEGGDYDSDWWRWEQRSSRIRDGSTSEAGAGHLERYADDHVLARKLGHNAIGVSLSWSRIHVAPHVFNREALAHYRHVLVSAKHNHLAPLCILHEVSAPAWFHDQGNWCAPDAATHFEAYAKEVAQSLGDLCDLWLPLYEPEHWLTLACREGEWPGPVAGLKSYNKASAQLVEAQCRAAVALRTQNPTARIGLSIRGAVVEPLDRDSPWDLRTAQSEQQRMNRRFYDALTAAVPAAGTPDFIGLSYYGNFKVRFAPLYWRGGFALPVEESGKVASADDTQMSAAGFEELLSLYAPLNIPIYLTGVGLDTDDDGMRCRFIQDHIQVLYRAVSAFEGGLDVRGWFNSALLDGFEWHHGYKRRYGMVYVKHPGLERTPNKSAWFFKDIAEHGQIRPGAALKYSKEE